MADGASDGTGTSNYDLFGGYCDEDDDSNMNGNGGNQSGSGEDMIQSDDGVAGPVSGGLCLLAFDDVCVGLLR